MRGITKAYPLVEDEEVGRSAPRMERCPISSGLTDYRMKLRVIDRLVLWLLLICLTAGATTVAADDPFRVDTQILAVDEKRLHQFQTMYHADKGYVVATAEWLNLHVNLETRRVCPFPDDIRSAFIALASGQSSSPMPVEAGRRMNVASPLFAIDGYHDEKG